MAVECLQREGTSCFQPYECNARANVYLQEASDALLKFIALESEPIDFIKVLCYALSFWNLTLLVAASKGSQVATDACYGTPEHQPGRFQF